LVWALRGLWRPVAPMWKRAVAWHRPIGFLAVLLLAAFASVATAVLALPTGAAFAAAWCARLPRGRAEARADAAAVRLGFGAELVAAVEHRIENAPHGLPMPLVRRAQGLRRRLGCAAPGGRHRGRRLSPCRRTAAAAPAAGAQAGADPSADRRAGP